jgi:hypothetical protein
MITHLFLIRARRPDALPDDRMDLIVEARNHADALELFRVERGYYDPDPDYAFPDEMDIEIDMVPMLTGERTSYNIA